MKMLNQYIRLVTQVGTYIVWLLEHLHKLVDIPFEIWSGHGSSDGVNMTTCFAVNHYSITSYSWCVNGKRTSVKSPVFYTKAIECVQCYM